MGSEALRAACPRLAADGAGTPAAIMRSEVWRRCHRRLIADHLVLVWACRCAT